SSAFHWPAESGATGRIDRGSVEGLGYDSPWARGTIMLKAVKRHGALGTRLVAAARIARGTPFFRVRTDRVRRQPTYQTVQIGPRRHTLSLGILQYINHSCEPNVIIDTKSRLCYAAREIPPREELSYFYPST